MVNFDVRVAATAMRIANNIANEVGNLTANNHHTKALWTIANAYSFVGSRSNLEMIMRAQEQLGYLKPHHIAMRQTVKEWIEGYITEANPEAWELLNSKL